MGLLTVQEVAKELKLSAYTVRELLKDGTLLGVKLGKSRQWRVHKVDLERYIAGLTSNRE